MFTLVSWTPTNLSFWTYISITSFNFPLSLFYFIFPKFLFTVLGTSVNLVLCFPPWWSEIIAMSCFTKTYGSVFFLCPREVVFWWQNHGILAWILTSFFWNWYHFIFILMMRKVKFREDSELFQDSELVSDVIRKKPKLDLRECLFSLNCLMLRECLISIYCEYAFLTQKN